MLKEKLKGFVTGVVVTSMVFAVSFTAFAATGSKTIQIAYDNIKIYVNEKLTPMTTDGQTVEPFTYQGRTYVPLNAVATALGQKVSWDGNTKSIYIGSAATEKDAATPTTPAEKDTPAATAPAPKEEAPAEKVIMDKNGIKVTYMGIEKLSSYSAGYQIKLKIENSNSKNYTVQVRDLSVNGIMCDSIFSCDVAAGKTAMDGIKIYKSYLDKINQTSITNAEFTLHVFGSDWEDRFDSSIISL